MNDHLSGWTDWQEAFTDWTDISISELHGLMTGLMTACDAPTADACRRSRRSRFSAER